MRFRFLSVSLCVLFVSIGASIALFPQQQEGQKPSEPTPQAAATKKRKRLVTDLSGFELLDSSKMRKERTMVGATRGLALAPTALAPKLGKFYGVAALFAWRTKGKANSFVLVFTDDDDVEVFRAEVNGDEYRYSPGAAHLKPGKNYAWMVQVNPPLFGATPSQPAGLVVVSDKERADIENALAQISSSDAYQAALARAKVFTDHRLWYNALGAYADLIARYPDRAELYEQRGMIYAQLEVTKELAEKNFARADELQAKEKAQH